MIYYDEDCCNIYRFKVIKIIDNQIVTYKVYATVYNKETNKKYRFKFYM